MLDSERDRIFEEWLEAHKGTFFTVSAFANAMADPPKLRVERELSEGGRPGAPTFARRSLRLSPSKRPKLDRRVGGSQLRLASHHRQSRESLTATMWARVPTVCFLRGALGVHLTESAA